MISSDLLHALFEISPSGIAIADRQGRYVRVNDAYCEIFGYSREELIGNTFSMILRDEDLLLEPVILNMALTQDQGAPSQWHVKHKSGRILHVHSSFKTFIREDGSAEILTILSDVSELLTSMLLLQERETQLQKINQTLESAVARRTRELEKANQALAQLATRDPLTGLLNRRAFEQECENAFYAADRYQHPVSILFLDIDYFKEVNDRFGHAIGDRVIQQAASLIQSMLRASDRLARWGGEEFVVLLPGTNQAEAIVVGEKIMAAVRDHVMKCDDYIVRITLSGGVAERRLNGSLKDILHLADTLLYKAKGSGRDHLERLTGV